MAEAPRLVIGVDFGTTYSGVAYCDDAGAKEGTSGIQIFTSWPGITNSNATNEKVPSRISYEADGEIKWGNKIRYNTRRAVHSCMKLKLDQETGDIAAELEKLTLDGMGFSKRDVLGLCADYLSELHKVVERSLQDQYGDALLPTLRKKYVVTVPAVWSDRAKDLTMKAFNKAAGIAADEICLVTEPEAAALYTLKQMMEGPNKSEIEVGDVFVLCDAGGGTVDLISYKIAQIEPLRIEEAAVGTGDKCGATFVDKYFLVWLEKWIGSERFNKIPPDKTRHGSQLMNSWEATKFNFTSREEEWDVQLPRECGVEDNEELNIQDRVLTLDSRQMKKIFEPVINRTLELIQGQVDAVQNAGLSKPKMVFVVGGFGRNPYLYEQVQVYCLGTGMKARQPKFPWSAVVRGAVICGLELVQDHSVASRFARKCYGTSADPSWDASKHHRDDFYIDKYDGSHRAKGQMKWLVVKGETLPDRNPKSISIDLVRHIRRHEPARCWGVLYSFQGETPPQRRSGADTQLKKVCRIEGDLTNLPLSSFIQHTTKKTGEPYWVVDFTLLAIFSGTGITWQCLYKGEAKGSVVQGEKSAPPTREIARDFGNHPPP
ncbi:hypothetical protein V491_09098 [Pseudogymnoascus sp. VKM F-3775]|nr:hypothetical protein V491_09098 [Pseudogymnoascus sp. VKM F-3775]